VQLRGRGGITFLSSLPSLPYPSESAQVDFEFNSDRGDRVTQIEEAHRGAAALSPNRSIALAISGGSVSSVGRVAARGRAVKSTAVSQDGLIPSAARPEPSRPRHYLDEPLSPFVLSHFQLACSSQRHPCRRHRCLLKSRIWLSFRTRRRGLEHLQLAPLSFSLACGCALPSSSFSPAPVSPYASRTRHGLTTRHFLIGLVALAQSQSVRFRHAELPGTSDRRGAVSDVVLRQ
jgi:hypothetical protein